MKAHFPLKHNKTHSATCGASPLIINKINQLRLFKGAIGWAHPTVALCNDFIGEHIETLKLQNKIEETLFLIGQQ